MRASLSQSEILQRNHVQSTAKALHFNSHMLQSRFKPMLCHTRCKPLLPSKRFWAGIAKPAVPAVAYVCATGAPDLDTIVHGLIAVRAKGQADQQHAVRFLIDTGATEAASQKPLSLPLG